MLTNTDLVELTTFRRLLHQYPEVSGEEVETARRIVEALGPLAPSQILTNLGGHGVAAVFDSGTPGPTVMFRAELDALPIHEISDNAWRSTIDGKGHLCGHDGHMTMLLGLGRLLHRTPPTKGRVVLMFQPSEEDGAGARRVVADPQYTQIKPDYAFAIHIEPGRPFGHVSTRAGLMNCASQGLTISLSGKTAHAATPEDGTSPAPAIAELIPSLNGLSGGTINEGSFQLVTLTHARIGTPSFGIAPGEAELFVTLRTAYDDTMEALSTQARNLATNAAKRHGLQVAFTVCDDFAASINDAEATDIARNAMDSLNIPFAEDDLPMRASEDFGVFGWDAKAAMLCLGPGKDYAALHNPDYDFPDDLTQTGVSLFHRITQDLLG